LACISTFLKVAKSSTFDNTATWFRMPFRLLVGLPDQYVY